MKYFIVFLSIFFSINSKAQTPIWSTDSSGRSYIQSWAWSIGMIYEENYVHNPSDGSGLIGPNQFFDNNSNYRDIVISINHRLYSAQARYDIVTDKLLFSAKSNTGNIDLEFPKLNVEYFILDGRKFVMNLPTEHYYEFKDGYYISYSKSVLSQQYLNGEIHDVINQQKAVYYTLNSKGKLHKNKNSQK